MQSNFTSQFFIGNRRKLRQSTADDTLIVVTANGLLQRGGDASYPFQQDAGFWYLTGVDEPDVVLVMQGDDEYLIVPGREAVREAFDGSIMVTELQKVSGITQVFDETTGWERLTKQLRAKKHVATLKPNPAKFDLFGIYTNPARGALVRKLKEIYEDLEIVDVRIELARLRMIKQPAEIKALQQAIDVTTAAIAEATDPKALKTYKFEYELEAAIAYGFRRRGAHGHAFDPIVASGKSAATIHSLANNQRLAKNVLVVIDVGAEHDHYDADITRTIAFGTPTARQKAVYQAVYDVQEYAFGLQKPGALIRENEKLIEHFMGEKLLELGLIKVNDHDSVRHYYPHACSHFLGLDPHDAGDYEQPLSAGVVLTVEPGIYIPEEGIGVRIEDDILITESGYEVLSAKLPRTL